MPFATIDGCRINYEIIGVGGPWVALSPGGRADMGAIRSLATLLAEAGNRVLIHDRRNCGKSDVWFDEARTEYEAWADDLSGLLRHLDAVPAVVGGSSSGCRLALLVALRHPEVVRALLLWRPSSGALAARRLAIQYYTTYIDSAREGGMVAVCATDHFSARIAANPVNRDRLMGMDPDRFIAILTAWREVFDQGAELPVFGVTETQLRSVAVPTCVIPGDDRTHSRQAGRMVHTLIAGSELHELSGEDQDRDVVPPEEWADESRLAAVLTNFISRSVG